MKHKQTNLALEKRRLRSSLAKACDLDSGLKSIIEQVGYPEPRITNPGFNTLVRVIVSQQLSTKAAAAISAKLEKSCKGNVTWRKILNRSDEQLRECGLSYRKIEYAKGLALAVKEEQLNLDEMHTMNTSQVIDAISALRGFGQWSAEIYAMFALGHTDIYPADDLALQIAVGRYYGLADKLSAKKTIELSQIWSPYRTAVALLMWKYYGSTTLQ